MKVTVIIPTCFSERLPGLIRTVESILTGSYKDVHIVIVADGDPKVYELMGDFVERKSYNNVTVILNKERVEYAASFNRAVREFDSDFYVWACDDLVFPPDCIKRAMEIMHKNIIAGNGIVSLSKTNKATTGLFGRKWRDRFPDRQVFCPDYIHYGADAEASCVAMELGAFAFLPKIANRVKHFIIRHDKTWGVVVKAGRCDREMKEERRKKGYKWGINFDLIKIK